MLAESCRVEGAGDAVMLLGLTMYYSMLYLPLSV